MKKESFLYTGIEGGVTCRTCQRQCAIPEGERGWCHTRINEGGKLYSVNYGEVSSLSINPIEKKPVFHFYPGSRWLSLGSLGCNFRCPGCQNWEIAHWKGEVMHTEYLHPEKLIVKAESSGCSGISWTFNEPVLWFEYILDVAKIAQAHGLYTNYVTNGFISNESLDMIAPYLDVYRVDLKGFSDRTYRRIGHIPAFRGILEVIVRVKEYGKHLEIVTNIIPGYNDDDAEIRDIASWIKKTLGAETPWHVTRFYPHCQLNHIAPTPLATLDRAWSIGKEEGLHYVYIGNVPGHEGENTYCHNCGELLIERSVFDIIRYRIQNGICSACGTRIPGYFEKE